MSNNSNSCANQCKGKAIMVLGTTSGAGKSWLCTALCRWYSRKGFKVAPYKAQNMSNNARVVKQSGNTSDYFEWGEIGAAQYFQALAANCIPDVRMNPVLLKPENDTSSQVVILGNVNHEISKLPWLSRPEHLWPHARAALHSLLDEYDLVIIEGAGSPAEINLRESDYVNMKVADEVNASCLLVTDIDRGGSFAHLYGTYQLLLPHEQSLFKGFVLNRFRGDPSLLSPGPEQLLALTGVPTVAIIPMFRNHGLPEEDGMHDTKYQSSHTQSSTSITTTTTTTMTRTIYKIGIIAYPQISNLDEFYTLVNVHYIHVIWIRDRRDMLDTDIHMIILPGSKCVMSDLQWLYSKQLHQSIYERFTQGVRILGICGGLQMLGKMINDPSHVENNKNNSIRGDNSNNNCSSSTTSSNNTSSSRYETHNNNDISNDDDDDDDDDDDGSSSSTQSKTNNSSSIQGLGLLHVQTTFHTHKYIQPTDIQFTTYITSPWNELSNVQSYGYEIHYGQTILCEEDEYHENTIEIQKNVKESYNGIVHIDDTHTISEMKITNGIDINENDVSNDSITSIRCTHSSSSSSSQHHTIPILYDSNHICIGWQHHNVLGIYIHGLFEDNRIMHALFGGDIITVDDIFNNLANHIDTCFNPSFLHSLAGI